MITLLVYLAGLGLVYWMTTYLPIPAPFSTFVKYLFIVIAFLAVLQAFGINTGLPVIR